MATKVADPYPVTTEDLERQLEDTHAGKKLESSSAGDPQGGGLITRAKDSTPFMIQHT